MLFLWGSGGSCAGDSPPDTLRICSQVGPASTKSTGEAHETSFTDVIRAIKLLVDKQVTRVQTPAQKYLNTGRGQPELLR